MKARDTFTAVPEVRSGDRGDHAAKVDAGVEHGKVGGHVSRLLRHLELVCSESNHTWFDATCPKSYQRNANK